MRSHCYTGVFEHATPGSLRPVSAAKTFLELAGSLDYPVFIVTATHAERREGCVIGEALSFPSVKDVDPGHPA